MFCPLNVYVGTTSCSPQTRWPPYVSSGDVEQVEGAEKITVKIFKSITLVHEAGMVLLEVRVTDCP